MERFWARMAKAGNDECWVWTRGKSTSGYGRFWIMGETRSAHRIAWELTNGSIPEGMCVLHRCDNPPCCNPAHLFLGTQADNTEDKRQKGRAASGTAHGRVTKPWRTARGERQWKSKLTDDTVLAIRKRRSEGVYLKHIAADFGISISEVSKICRGATWKHLLENIDDRS